MDIVAENLSADTLKARNVTVRGQDVLAWFESRLSASVSFVGVFQSLDDAPPRNGAVAIVGSRDYIYQDPPGEWREFGDEGQVGALTQAVQALRDGLSAYATKDDLSAAVGQSLSGLSYDYDDESPWMERALRDVLSAFGGEVRNFPAE